MIHEMGIYLLPDAFTGFLRNRWVMVAAAVFLPLFAVVMVNANDQRDDGFSLPTNAGAHELTAHDGED